MTGETAKARKAVAERVWQELRTPAGQRAASQAAGDMARMALRVVVMLGVAGLLHLAVQSFEWYDSLSSGEALPASVVQGLLALVALFGAYMMYARGQSASVVNDALRNLEAWQRTIEAHQAKDQVDRFTAAAGEVRQRCSRFLLGEDFSFEAVNDLAALAPVPHNAVPPALLVDMGLLGRATLLRVRGHIPMFKALSVATVALVALAVPAWNVGGLTVVLVSQTFVVAFQTLMVFAKA